MTVKSVGSESLGTVLPPITWLPEAMSQAMLATPPESYRQTSRPRAEWKAEIDPYSDGLPEEVAEEQARKYKEFFRVFLDHDDAISRVTFWGVTDATSWKNDWPVPGRTNYPLLFDRSGRPKAAFDSVVEIANQ